MAPADCSIPNEGIEKSSKHGGFLAFGGISTAYSDSLASGIRAVLKHGRGMGEQKMFGGVCFTLNGHMVCGVVQDDLMVRVGPGAYQESLKRPHARPMDFAGRPMVGYVYVAAIGIKNKASLESWLGAAVAYARTLPPKPTN